MQANTKQHNNNLDLHYTKVNSDFADFERERMAKKMRQQDFCSQITQQAHEDYQAREHQRMIDRMPIKTTFGPEEGKGTLNF